MPTTWFWLVRQVTICLSNPVAFQYPDTVARLERFPFGYLTSLVLKKNLSCSKSPKQTHTESVTLQFLFFYLNVCVCIYIIWYEPGKSHGSDLFTSTSGMMDAGKGQDWALRFKYCTTSSSSVGWNLNPGGSLRTPFFTKFSFSISILSTTN